MDTVDTLLVNAIELAISDEYTFEPPSTVEGEIRFKGDSWDGYVDYKIANFVIAAQRDITSKAIKYSNGMPQSCIDNLKQQRFAIRVSPGSSIIEVNLAELIRAFAELTPFQCALLTIWSILGLGYLAQDKYHKHMEKIKKLADDSVEKQRAHELNMALIKILTKQETPLNNLLLSMKDDEEVRFPHSDKYYSKKDALEEMRFSRIAKMQIAENDRIAFHADGYYQVQNIDLRGGVITMSNGKFTFHAFTKKLQPEERDKFWNAIKKAHKIDRKVCLQIDATRVGKRLISVEVVGIGAPRVGAIRLGSKQYYDSTNE